MARDNWSQADQRRRHMYEDQHGRSWFAMIELKTGHPCGNISPRFSAPLIPDQKYLVVPNDIARANVLHIDYERWVSDLAAAREQYRKEIVQAANARQWEIPGPNEALPQNILDIVGPGPKPIEPVIAAMQGNPWILGFTDKADPRLSHLVQTRRDRARAVDLSDFPDYSTVPDYADVEDEHDPDATGGKVTPVGQRRRGRPPKAANVEV